MKPICIEKNIQATPEQVWKAITEKEIMKQWYFDIPDFELKVHTTFNFYEGEAKKYHHRGVMKEIIPYKKLKHTWTHPSHSQGNSMLTWELYPDAQYTKLVLTHDGIENFADAGTAFSRENYEVGWNEFLQTLKAFLEKQ